MTIRVLLVLMMVASALAGCIRQDNHGGGSHVPAGTHADLIVVNAKVWTGDPARPEAQAFAVRDGRFVYVGDGDGAAAWRGPDTRVVDAAGARLIPGLIDAHVHLIGGGLQLARLNLRDAADRAAFIAAVADRARRAPKGEWILGGRWSTESWADPSPPTKEWIDPVTPEHPALLTRMDGHSALANSAALRLAGIDRNGPADPPGGRIDRDPRSGEPTGLLREGAVDLVSRLIPKETPAQLDSALAAAMREAHRHGITSVHTMSEWAELSAFARARDEGRLTLRVRFYVSEDDWTKYFEQARRIHGDDVLRVAGFKQFMDGSLGSRTAFMAEPYASLRERYRSPMS